MRRTRHALCRSVDHARVQAWHHTPGMSSSRHGLRAQTWVSPSSTKQKSRHRNEAGFNCLYGWLHCRLIGYGHSTIFRPNCKVWKPADRRPAMRLCVRLCAYLRAKIKCAATSTTNFDVNPQQFTPMQTRVDCCIILVQFVTDARCCPLNASLLPRHIAHNKRSWSLQLLRRPLLHTTYTTLPSVCRGR